LIRSPGVEAVDPKLQLLATGAKSAPEGIQPIYRYDAENDGNWFLQPDSSWNGRAAENNGCQEAKFEAVGLSLLDAIPARAVCLLVSRPTEDAPAESNSYITVRLRSLRQRTARIQCGRTRSLRRRPSRPPGHMLASRDPRCGQSGTAGIVGKRVLSPFLRCLAPLMAEARSFGRSGAMRA